MRCMHERICDAHHHYVIVTFSFSHSFLLCGTLLSIVLRSAPRAYVCSRREVRLPVTHCMSKLELSLNWRFNLLSNFYFSNMSLLFVKL